MILWECGNFKPQPAEHYRDLLARGLTQHVRLDTNHIATALALQAAGSPVIMMQGAGGAWPARLAGERSLWQHRLDPGFKPRDDVHACLLITEGWAIQADRVRQTLRAFRAAGVTVDAVWMDWEGDPYSWIDAYEQASHCARCRETIPAYALAAPPAFHAWRWRLYLDLLAAYLAAPVKEIFPKAETTNWMLVLSTPERPVVSWSDRAIPPGIPALFTASNPVAYGNTVYWRKAWDATWTADRDSVDRFYMHLLLRQVSADAANRARWAPWMKSFPWVDRWCPDDEDPSIPLMSRERYREALRHIWLRGVAGMQVFNPARKGYRAIVLSEVEDAVAVYDEMLEYKDILARGQAMNTNVPGPRDAGVLWSGVMSGDRAVVRVVRLDGSSGRFTLEPWPGQRVEIEAGPTGQTLVLKREATTERGAK
jgi:hypothetical protein